jgi:MFS transporter, DHA3 family, macrolide efflux protein
MKAALKNKKTLFAPQTSIWSNSNFVNLWIGGAFSVVGYRLYSLIMSWFVIDITGSTSILGLLFVCWAIPNMFFMIVGGALSDNFDKVKIMWYSDITRAVVLTLLLLFYLNDLTFIFFLFAISLIFGISNALFVPARDALLPSILDKELIQKGNSLREMVNQIAVVLGPLLGAVGIKLLGVGEAFLLPILFMLISAFFIKKISVNQPAQSKKSTKEIFREVKQGYVLIKNHKAIVFMFFCMAIFNLGYFGPLVIGLPYLSNKVLEAGITGFTFLEIALAIGMLCGSVLCSKVKMERTGIIVYSSTIISGFLFSMIGFINQILIIGMIMFVIGCLVTIINILMYSAVQTTFDVKVIGIVLGFLNFMVVGMDPVSFFVSGIAFDVFKAEYVFFTGGLLVALAGLVGISLKSTRSLKNYSLGG